MRVPESDAVHGDVHGFTVTERTSPVHGATLVVVLQTLHETQVQHETIELRTESLVRVRRRPDEKKPGEQNGKIVVREIPAFDARPVGTEDLLLQRERAVVPNEETVEECVDEPRMDECEVYDRDEHREDHGFQFELFVYCFVVLFVVKKGHVDLTDTRFQEPTRSLR